MRQQTAQRLRRSLREFQRADRTLADTQKVHQQGMTDEEVLDQAATTYVQGRRDLQRAIRDAEEEVPER